MLIYVMVKEKIEEDFAFNMNVLDHNTERTILFWKHEVNPVKTGAWDV